MKIKATYGNLWDPAIEILKWKFITLNTYIRKEERTQTMTLRN